MTFWLGEQHDFWCDARGMGHRDRCLFSYTVDSQFRCVVASDPDHELVLLSGDQVAGVGESAGQDTDGQLTRSSKLRDLGHNAVELGYVCWKHHRDRC